MAELAVVYDATPVPRTASDVLARSDDGEEGTGTGGNGEMAHRERRVGREGGHRYRLRPRQSAATRA